jgi:hypothetical protein
MLAVLQLGRASSLAQKPVDVFSTRQVAGTQNFDGHGSIQLRVARPENAAERADSQLLQELELPQAPMRQPGGRPRALVAKGPQGATSIPRRSFKNKRRL